MEIEKGILNYYHELQQDNGQGVELIVRYDQDTGSYLITRDTNIVNIQSVAHTLTK